MNTGGAGDALGSGGHIGGGGGMGGATSSGGSTGIATGGAAPGAPDVPSDAKLAGVTPSQKGALCDWYVGLLGGYGVENACSAVTSVKNYENQAQCVAGGLNYNCPILTVGQFEMCALAQVRSRGCEYPDAQCHWVFCR